MGHLEKAVNIAELGQSSLWVIYGKSGSGKTHLASTFPKPLLYLGIGDDGSNTIADVAGISAIMIKSPTHLKEILTEVRGDFTYKTVVLDTFSLIVNEWTDINAIQKKKKMTQQMWGDIKTDTEELIRLAHKAARDRIMVLTAHEVADAFEGMEDEIAPDIRPNVSKGARTYLEGMANYGIHCTVVTKEIEDAEGNTTEISRHAVHLGSNPYYWVKTQKSAGIELPRLLLNPSYSKIIKLLRGEKANGKKN